MAFEKRAVSSLAIFCAVLSLAKCSPPGLLTGAFTTRSTNPAFQCNQVHPGPVYDDVVVEARINFFDNEDDDTYTSEDCENTPMDDCDMQASIFIDDQELFGKWPKNARFTEVVHQWDGNDIRPDNARYGPGHDQHNYIACKFVPQLSVVTVRVKLDDVDIIGVDNVNNMNCQWAPKRVGENQLDAQWETINCCTDYIRDMDSTVRHELKIDIRAYHDPTGASCPASGRKADAVGARSGRRGLFGSWGSGK